MPDHDYLEGVVKEYDPQFARRYRDEYDTRALEAGAAGDHWCKILHGLSASFGRPIDVLDIGCGTGRYFHCLSRVRQLVGVDIAAPMLELARDPIRRDQFDIQTITLLCGDALSMALPQAQFDLVYSIGVLGEHAPLDATVTHRLRELLAPGGLLFVTAVDATSRVIAFENAPIPFARRLARRSFPFLPHGVRRLLNRRLSPNYVSRAQLDSAFASAGFAEFTLTPYVHPSGFQATHWECLARNRGA